MPYELYLGSSWLQTRFFCVNRINPSYNWLLLPYIWSFRLDYFRLFARNYYPALQLYFLYFTRCLLISPLETILASFELSQTSELEHAKISAFLIAGLCIFMTSKTNLNGTVSGWKSMTMVRCRFFDRKYRSNQTE